MEGTRPTELINLFKKTPAHIHTIPLSPQRPKPPFANTGRLTSRLASPSSRMDDPSKESKASFFDRLYSIHDGCLDEDEGEGASVSLPLSGRAGASNRVTTGRNMKHTADPTGTPVEAAHPTVPYHGQKLPDSLRFEFADRKTPGRSCKRAVRESPAPKSTLFMGMYFCNRARSSEEKCLRLYKRFTRFYTQQLEKPSKKVEGAESSRTRGLLHIWRVQQLRTSCNPYRSGQ